MEPPYDRLKGVEATISGYTGGRLERPTYEAVTGGGTGHYEAVRIIYDPERISYERLLEVFWRNVDPFDDGGQFCDRGPSYRTAIFAHDDHQRDLARDSREAVETRFDQSVVTPIETAEAFYPAEDYHQDYYEKNPLRYKFYRYRCGRDQRLESLWGEEAGGDANQ
ncbi:MAG: peptide-methionine (S)-S-oxide reductase MsrA [Arhodomonas sp.]|nr:peptide-methionine (S)-S-oxide reductase MsrA [Arhodomonas sp.]